VNTVRSIGHGWHFGTTARRSIVGRFILTETRYPARLQTPKHAHATPAFCLVLNGQYEQRFQKQDVVYRTSTVLFRPPAVEHIDRISAAGATCFIIEPDSTWLKESGLERLILGYALSHAGSKAMWLVNHALREFRHPDGVTPLALEGLVLALGAEFARIPEPRVRRRCPPWLLRVRESLDEALSSRLTLAELAAEADVHPVHMAAAFRRAFGVPVGEYARARRIEAGRHALDDRSRPINEIALTLGFSSQSHFTRVFRRQTGLTPYAYRRQHVRA
jgi:AraC family transcriptional regulator